MPGRAHISFIVAIEVAMPACGLFIIDDAMAASPIVALAADIAVLVTGVGAMAAGDIAAGDMAFAVAMSTFPIVEEVVLVAMPFMPGMLAIFILAVVSFRLRWARWTRWRMVFV